MDIRWTTDGESYEGEQKKSRLSCEEESPFLEEEIDLYGNNILSNCALKGHGLHIAQGFTLGIEHSPPYAPKGQKHSIG